jgi:adenylate cyclase
MKQLAPGTKNKIKTILFATLAGIIIGIIFANIAFGFTFFRIIKGAAIGFLITSISSSFEMFLFQKKFKRLSFLFELTSRSAFYVLLITSATFIVVIIHESIENKTDLLTTIKGEYIKKFLSSDFIYIFIFAIAASLLINFIWQINKMLGKGVLLNVMLGKYRRPISEERIFMFLDIKSSTTLAEKLGTTMYSSFLQDFFYDITDPIIETRAEVYQYIGDEVVLTWKNGSTVYNDRAVSCFFKIKTKIDERSNYYFNLYGLKPEFKAGIHSGYAVVTEIGDYKKEIVFHGDSVNTASRIRSEAGMTGKDLLISENLLKSISNDYKSNLLIESIGKIKLRGKENEIELYSVNELQHND